jgi:hypothetical protein
MRSRRVVIILVVVIALAGGAWLVSRGLQRLPATVEAWCATQLLAIADAHLGPKLTFDKLHYHYPNSVELTNVRLTAGTEVILEAAAAGITLARVPRPGEPIVLEKASFD